MKCNVHCENIYTNELPISVKEVEKYSVELFDFAFKCISSELFSDSCNYDFDILLCDDKFIHSINKEYRNIDRATDVITFALYADSADKIISGNTVNLGQIIISIDKTYTQAKDNHFEPEYELLNLLSHGILHLLGIDHPTDEELETMLNLQDKMIKSINYVKI